MRPQRLLAPRLPDLLGVILLAAAQICAILPAGLAESLAWIGGQIERAARLGRPLGICPLRTGKCPRRDHPTRAPRGTRRRWPGGRVELAPFRAFRCCCRHGAHAAGGHRVGRRDRRECDRPDAASDPHAHGPHRDPRRCTTAPGSAGPASRRDRCGTRRPASAGDAQPRGRSSRRQMHPARRPGGDRPDGPRTAGAVRHLSGRGAPVADRTRHPHRPPPRPRADARRSGGPPRSSPTPLLPSCVAASNNGMRSTRSHGRTRTPRTARADDHRDRRSPQPSARHRRRRIRARPHRPRMISPCGCSAWRGRTSCAAAPAAC